MYLSRGEGREKDMERNIDARERNMGFLVAPGTHPTGHQTHNLDMCPDLKPNP